MPLGGVHRAPYIMLSSCYRQQQQIRKTREGVTLRQKHCRCTSVGVKHAHQVIPAGDGQGEWGVATPQHVGVCFVGQEEPDYVPGTLRGEKGRTAG